MEGLLKRKYNYLHFLETVTLKAGYSLLVRVGAHVQNPINLTPNTKKGKGKQTNQTKTNS